MRKNLVTVALAFAIPALPAFAIRTTTLTWNGGTGLWFSNNWSIGTAQPSVVDDVQIDGGKSVNSVVTLSGTSTVNSLLLDAGDHLFIGNNSGDGSTNTLTTTLDATNNGIISPGSNQYDTLSITGTLTNNGVLQSNNNSIFYVNAATLVNNGTIDIGETAGDVLADAEFNKANIAGGMTITGSGNISIHDGGTLSFDHAMNINSTGYLNANSNDPCLLIDAPSNISLAGITGSGPIRASGNTTLITLNTTVTTVSYAGNLTGNISVVKNGTGTQIFSGNNTYTGTTDINAGTLEVDNADTTFGSGGVGFGNLTVHSNGTLAGNGSTACFVTIASGGTVSPGTSGGANAGTFTAGITLLLNAGSTLKMDISKSTAASDFVRVQNGEFEASSVNVQLVPHGNLTWHSTIPLINWSGAIQIGGQTIDASAFHLLPSGVLGNFVVDNNADTVSFFVLANAGDANEDGKVDLNDLNAVLNHLGAADSNWTDGNFDGAATIDLNDLNAVLNNLGTNSIPAATLAAAEALVAGTAPVPEPASLAFLSAGSLLLLRRKRS